jgi:P63C domain
MDDLFGNDQTPQEKGGKARAAKLSAEERSDIAKRAAEARWGPSSEIPLATHGSADQPLMIGKAEITCFVLEDGRRVISQRGMNAALGRAEAGAKSRRRPTETNAGNLPAFLFPLNIRPFISNELASSAISPISFRIPSTGVIGYGYPAELLPDVCSVWMQAHAKGVLTPAQYSTANAASIVVQALAKVGIVALVDEATGYQEVRDRRALEEILNKYISKELHQWTKTFPDEYFSGIFRLKNWALPKLPTARPGAMAQVTNDIVYQRLAPGVLRELEVVNPTDGKGRRKSKHHQHLTRDHGHPKLREHLSNVVTLMRVSDSWTGFKRLIDRAIPRISAPGELPYYTGDDDGNA